MRHKAIEKMAGDYDIKIRDLEQTNAELTLKVQKQNNEVASQSLELAKLREGNMHLENALLDEKSLSKRFNELRSEQNEVFQRILDKKDQSLTEKEEEIESLRKQRLELTDQLFGRNETIEAKDKELSDLREQLQMVSQSYNNTENRLTIVENEHAEFEKQANHNIELAWNNAVTECVRLVNAHSKTGHHSINRNPMESWHLMEEHTRIPLVKALKSLTKANPQP